MPNITLTTVAACLLCAAAGVSAGFVVRPVLAPLVCVAQSDPVSDGFFRMDRQPEFGNRRY